jgi:hypothetical protein
MYCLVPALYKVVQGGTRWYKVVQGGTGWYMTVQATVYGGTWGYMAVQESIKLYLNRTNVLILSGYAFLLDLLLQFCMAESAVLETSVSIHNSASSSKVQSTAACPAACFVTLPRPFGRFLLPRPALFFVGAEAASAAGAGCMQGR